MRNRRSFTLIELLVTITIVVILASMVMFALHQAQVSARQSRTQSTITKLHALISQQWATYRTRRVPVAATGLEPEYAAELSLVAKRVLIRMDLPDRWSEVKAVVTDPTVDPDGTPSNWKSQPITVNTLTYNLSATATARGYFRYFFDLDTPADTSDSLEVSPDYQNAECLYMIVTMGLPVEDEASANFAETEIGDVDGDGAKEFLDAWGTPIGFLRWPVGFVNYAGNAEFGHLSDLQPERSTTSPCRPNEAEHHDPFDPRGVDDFAFFVFPLVYSAGPDKLYDIFPGGANDVIDDPYSVYRAATDCSDDYVGMPKDQDNLGGSGDGELSHQDNIHNHLLEASVE